MRSCNYFCTPISHHFRKATIVRFSKAPVYCSHNVCHFLTPVFNSLQPLECLGHAAFLDADREGNGHDLLIHGPNRLCDRLAANLKFPRNGIAFCAIAAFAKALQVLNRCLATRRLRHDVVAVQSKGIVGRTAEPASAADEPVTGQNLCANRICDLCLAHHRLSLSR
jgi:hypothetical protein